MFYKITEYPSSYPEDEPNRRLPDINKASRSIIFPEISLEEGLKKVFKMADKYYSNG